MKLTTIKKALVIGAFTASAGIASQAMAAPVFSFTEYGGFVAGQVGVAGYTNEVTGDASVIPGTTVYSTMSWNLGQNPKSSLVLTTVQAPTHINIGAWAMISKLTHNNVVIQNAANWGPQDILGRLVITDSDGAPQTVMDSPDAIAISLLETPNVNPCTEANPEGTTCDDVFSFGVGGLAPLYFSANDGTNWMAEFKLGNLVNATLLDGSIYTAESNTSSLEVLMRVTQVPEPATLGIFGLGLLGLGMIRRRKQDI